VIIVNKVINMYILIFLASEALYLPLDPYELHTYVKWITLIIFFIASFGVWFITGDMQN